MAKYHERFNINVNVQECRKRFINRAYNNIFNLLPRNHYDHELIKKVVSALGDYYSEKSLTKYIGLDFNKALIAIETLYNSLSEYESSYSIRNRNVLYKLIKELFDLSEIDIGIKWENGQFLPVGAKELDKTLVNDSLKWLRKHRFNLVLIPFEKGLSHYLHSTNKPQLYADVITDMYESLEALAKLACQNDKDLSANRELFLSRIKATEEYKAILKEYINYANKFRHGTSKLKRKPVVNKPEVESFIYLTGLFIRLVTLSNFSEEN